MATSLYTNVEVALSGGTFRTIAALVYGPFAVHEDGETAWVAPGTDAEDWAEVPTFALTHIHTGYVLLDGKASELALTRAALALESDPEIRAFFDSYDTAETVRAAITPELKARVRTILETALAEG